MRSPPNAHHFGALQEVKVAGSSRTSTAKPVRDKPTAKPACGTTVSVERRARSRQAKVPMRHSRLAGLTLTALTGFLGGMSASAQVGPLFLIDLGPGTSA